MSELDPKTREALERAYRETPGAGPEARERLTARLESERERGIARPRVAISPVSALAAGFALVALGAVLGLWYASRDRVPAEPVGGPVAAVPADSVHMVRFVFVAP